MRKYQKMIYIFLLVLLTACGSDRANSSDASKDSDVAGVVEVLDHDGDGIVNSLDPDDDNDGLLDVDDPNDTNSDTDGDGILDGADADVNGDGLVDNGTDSDGDGINDASDVDANGDGIADNNSTDSDGDGIADNHDSVDNNQDQDGDGLADALDPNDYSMDTDGDGIPDGADVDVNGDGINDNGVDSDGDGINDLSDIDSNAGSIDTDNDGIINSQDPDDDNDAVSDFLELQRGTNPLLADSDGDGKKDNIEGTKDSDGDGIIDALDSAILDSDHDGVLDEQDNDNSSPTNDSDGDGQANIKELECGNDGDPLDSTKRCLWETETADGTAINSVGFAYVPGGFDVDGDGVNEGGFWLSSYQARATSDEINKRIVIESIGGYQAFIKSKFHLVNSTKEIRGYQIDSLTDTLLGNKLSFEEAYSQLNTRVTNMAPYLALASLKTYEILDNEGNLINNDFGLLTQKQYVHIMLLLEADFNNGGDGTHLRNGLLGTDKDLPVINYRVRVYEFGEEYNEYLRDLIWLIDESLNVKFDLDDVKSWWKVYPDDIRYNHLDDIYGANSTLDVGFGAGLTKDNYAVVVRGGNKLNLLQGTTGIETDSVDNTNGIGFRAATPYLQ